MVCAVSLVGQWIEEARAKLAGGSDLRIHMYHGAARNRCSETLATEFDLVVTTYATLAADRFDKVGGGDGPLHAVEWRRVILDESHTIKGDNHHSSACKQLSAQRRWCARAPAAVL